MEEVRKKQGIEAIQAERDEKAHLRALNKMQRLHGSQPGKILKMVR